MHFSTRVFVVASATLCVSTLAMAGGDSPTVGLISKEKSAAPGYRLFAPLNGTQTFLIDSDGNKINEWLDDNPAGNALYLLENGTLLRCSDNGPQEGSVLAAGGDGGCVRIFDWDNTLLWDFCYNTPEGRLHHDIEPMPNGNVLMIAWEYKSREEAEAAGRDPSLINTDNNSLWPLHIIEIAPDIGSPEGNIVWEWHLWDHVVQDFDPNQANYGVIADNPGKVDLNYVRNTSGDWIHANSIDYNAELDQILISTPFLNEIWVINHDLTSAEAATSAGDLVYRWGNPQVYDRGTADDQELFFNHDARWVPEGYPGAGNITVFNNGNGRPDVLYSRADELTPPLEKDGSYTLTTGEAYGPAVASIIFEADPQTDFYSSGLSGVERTPEGNTLICMGRGSGTDPVGGRFFEVDENGDVVWLYINPVTTSGPLAQGSQPAGQNAFRCSYYPPDFAGFAGKDMSPQGPLELPSMNCVYDLDDDGSVGGSDLGLMLSSWSSPYDGADLGALLAEWGPCLTP